MNAVFKYIVFVLFTMSAIVTSAQDLNSYKWKNRLVIISVNDLNSSAYKRQLDLLFSDRNGLEERKIVVLAVLDSIFKDHSNNSWFIQKGTNSFGLNSDSQFEMLLIGLDGGVKFRKSNPVTRKELYGLIDRMPMRRQELKTKN
ncbi:MAG: DUF4174 domain-containing protein [Flavobacteriaceae bacterium]|nr:DUF4174 domain-containing protein [Flavobacteriaceae bacterium]